MLKSIKARLQNKKGFTLLEVVAVLAVLGVLAAIMVPNVSSVNNSATETKLKSDIQVLDSALALYWSQQGNKYPATLTDATFKTLIPASVKDTDLAKFTYTPAADSLSYTLTTTDKLTSTGAVYKSPGSK